MSETSKRTAAEEALTLAMWPERTAPTTQNISLAPNFSAFSMPERTYPSPETYHAFASYTAQCVLAASFSELDELRAGRSFSALDRPNWARACTTAEVLKAAILADIAAAVAAERDRCLHDIDQAIIDARRACAETRPILENAAGALAEAQNVHRAAYGAYSHDYGNLEALLELVGAGPVD